MSHPVLFETGPGPTLFVNSVGTKYWMLNGSLHSEDGPALEFKNGDKRWYIRGNRHRTDGPAVERVTGQKEWWLNGELHREDGPAVVCNGFKEWWLDGVKYDPIVWLVKLYELNSK